MDNRWVGVGLMVLAGAILVIGLRGAPARAQDTTGFTKCITLKTEYVNDWSEVDEGKLPAIPAGWTVVSGGAVPKGMQYIGTITVCK